MNIHYKFAPWCVVIVYLSVHRAEPLTGLPGVRQKAHPDPPPVVPHPESLAAQAAYAEALLPGSCSGLNCFQASGSSPRLLQGPIL